MQQIHKGPPPLCVADLQRELVRTQRETKQVPVAGDWEPKSCAPAIREALHRDQRGVCGYCMQSITIEGHRDPPQRTGGRGMRIEHVVPRSTAPEQMYNWQNLLGCCGGRSPYLKGEWHEHCDRLRRNRPLTLSPYRNTPDLRTALVYRRTHQGVEVAASPNLDAETSRAIERDIDVLGLNVPPLCERREAMQRSLGQTIRRAEAKGRRPQMIKSLLESLDDPSATPVEFPAIVRRYLQAKLSAP